MAGDIGAGADAGERPGTCISAARPLAQLPHSHGMLAPTGAAREQKIGALLAARRSRTPSMYADEKSDEVVVPRKRPNNVSWRRHAFEKLCLRQAQAASSMRWTLLQFHGNSDVEVRHRQQLGLALGEPFACGCAPRLRVAYAGAGSDTLGSGDRDK